jgi:hypothetical protein
MTGNRDREWNSMGTGLRSRNLFEGCLSLGFDEIESAIATKVGIYAFENVRG